MAADGVDRGSQTGAAMEPSTGRAARQATGAWPCQSGYIAGGTKPGCVSPGGGQEQSALPGRRTAATARKPYENKNKKASLKQQSRLAADIPAVRTVNNPLAGPCVFRDCARELALSIHPLCCFKVGRSTLTQSSWTASARRCSRKWMSGHAAHALVSPSDRGQFRTLNRFFAGRSPSAKSKEISVFP
jgi:hypothetical protein